MAQHVKMYFYHFYILQSAFIEEQQWAIEEVRLTYKDDICYLCQRRNGKKQRNLVQYMHLCVRFGKIFFYFEFFYFNLVFQKRRLVMGCFE